MTPSPQLTVQWWTGKTPALEVIGHRWVSPDAFDAMARSYGYKSE